MSHTNGVDLQKSCEVVLKALVLDNGQVKVYIKPIKSIGPQEFHGAVGKRQPVALIADVAVRLGSLHSQYGLQILVAVLVCVEAVVPDNMASNSTRKSIMPTLLLFFLGGGVETKPFGVVALWRSGSVGDLPARDRRFQSPAGYKLCCGAVSLDKALYQLVHSLDPGENGYSKSVSNRDG